MIGAHPSNCCFAVNHSCWMEDGRKILPTEYVSCCIGLLLLPLMLLSIELELAGWNFAVEHSSYHLRTFAKNTMLANCSITAKMLTSIWMIAVDETTSDAEAC